jgi:hypothetical protein
MCVSIAVACCFGGVFYLKGRKSLVLPLHRHPMVPAVAGMHRVQVYGSTCLYSVHACVVLYCWALCVVQLGLDSFNG